MQPIVDEMVLEQITQGSGRKFKGAGQVLKGCLQNFIWLCVNQLIGLRSAGPTSEQRPAFVAPPRRQGSIGDVQKAKVFNGPKFLAKLQRQFDHAPHREAVNRLTLRTRQRRSKLYGASAGLLKHAER